MAVSSFALTTLANVKTALGITDSSQDTLLEQLIDRASYDIEVKTGRKLKARKYNDGASTHATTTVEDEPRIILSGSLTKDGGDTLKDEEGYGLFLLPQWPVQANSVLTFALEPLSYRDASGSTWGTALTEHVDYVVDRIKGEIRLLSGRFAQGVMNYRITMAAGYQFGSALPYVPPNLQQLCIEVVKRMFRDEYGVQSETIGTWSRSYNVEEASKKIDDQIALLARL